MSADIVFDVVVVGSARAGTAAAYKLAEEGVDVALVERAKQPGMKNVTGGVLYGEIMDDLVPEYPEEFAPMPPFWWSDALGMFDAEE
jgi:electron transfer flavoprotein-quinone oxidoreductase